MCTTGSTEQNLMLCCREPQIIIVGARSCEWQARGPELGEAAESRGGGRSCHEVITLECIISPCPALALLLRLGCGRARGCAAAAPMRVIRTKRNPREGRRARKRETLYGMTGMGGGRKEQKGGFTFFTFRFGKQAGRPSQPTEGRVPCRVLPAPC